MRIKILFMLLYYNTLFFNLIGEEAETGKFVKGSIPIISITNKVITKYIDFFIIITQLTLHKYLQ